jgi:hypothetical protein
MATLMELLGRPEVKLAEVTAHLDALSAAERIGQVAALGKKQQMKLWDLAEHSQPLELAYLVPATAKPFEFFPFAGKNSLPLFTRFKKVFYRDTKGNICGYNANPPLVRATIGHGYFVVGKNPKAAKSELQVDYTRIPTEHPPGWPEIKSNDVFPTKFVFGGTKDNLRWVSRHVLIGRAFKMGESPMPNWFVLCREADIAPDGYLLK